MKKHFYSDIIDIHIIEVELRSMDLSDEEIQHLLNIAHETVHHHIVDAVLSELSEEDKKIFLMYLVDETHEELWNHLSRKVDHVHDKIQHTARKVQKMLLEDIKELMSEDADKTED